jgi:ribonuclease HI
MKVIKVFTDGSCSGNGKKWAHGGCGVYFPNKELDNISIKYIFDGPTTNQKTELYAIYLALKKILDSDLKYDLINVYTDSLYSLNCFTKWIKGWIKKKWISSNGKPVKNQKIIKMIWGLIKNKQSKIKFFHVRSHTGKKDFLSVCNDMADKLATQYQNNKVNKQMDENKEKDNKTKIVVDEVVADNHKIKISIKTKTKKQSDNKSKKSKKTKKKRVIRIDTSY